MSGAAIAAAVVGSVASGMISSAMADDSSGGQLSDNQVIGSEELLRAIRQYSAQNLSTSQSEYSKQQAIADSQSIVAGLFNTYRNTDLPQIYSAESSSGGYNNTTSQLLANDAYASTLTKASGLILDTIQKYRGLQQQDYNVMSALVGRMPAPGNYDISQNANSRAMANTIGQGLGNLAGSIVTNWNSSPGITDKTPSTYSTDIIVGP